MLGRDLVSTAPSDIALAPRDRAALDLTDMTAMVTALDAVRPDLVINAAGYTAVDRAERSRSEAFAVNATSVATLGRLCAERRVRIIHFSTDYVFPGTSSHPYREDDDPAPLSVYGESKLAGEEALRRSGATWTILRTQWLFGLHGASFPRTMWERASRKQMTRVVMDQRGRPTHTIDLARATWRIAAMELVGTYHVANTGHASWYEVAKFVFEAAGAAQLLSPCTSLEFPRPAPRPSRIVLDTTKVETALKEQLPHWRDALAHFLAALRATPPLLTSPQ